MKVGAHLSSDWGSWGRRIWSLKSAWVTYYRRSYFKKQDKTNKQTPRGKWRTPKCLLSSRQNMYAFTFSEAEPTPLTSKAICPPSPHHLPRRHALWGCMLKATCEFFKLPSWDVTANIQYFSLQYSFAGDSQEPYVNFIDLKENHRDSVCLLNIILDLQLKSHVCSVSLGTASSAPSLIPRETPHTFL